ncbi:4-hydroxythreonine-4-phosphate dehydrogenase [Hyella patelloides LEGE 07179]|uniref:4-hydroxythreonine-4-phosphate dehydrogenase n=1 Tax=Hyella patelloides LEGE 07179 TaxID=945734 RepID=A0A563W315_9CYAN|nr:4-hydroxythreonine-4-phosphate dehydrogenase PdxA [Hyella patelloides]VEP18099.1 4-hydroxythreonine-4-phosphate dehydrogenase [Hyella patelloides LEGE 07179]
MSQLPHLAITMGDPAGIGSEVILKALADPTVTTDCHISIIGDRWLLKATYQHLLTQTDISLKELANPDNLSIIDCPGEVQVALGEGNFSTGAASFNFLTTAIDLTQQGKFQGIVTAPIAKNLWQQAGYNYPGQTEVLAEKAEVDRFGMLFAAKSPHNGWILRALLATTHIPLSQVPQALNPELMSRKLDLLLDSLSTDFGIDDATIAIAGLNPHSGEAGNLGTEEVTWLNSWLKKEQAKRPNTKLIGLIPPDTMWVKPGQAWFGNSGKTPSVADAYLALYHDQGLIPVKLMAFDCAVNTTIGLPFVRTSPDHGTAFDIAGKGVAEANSMKAAIELAVDIIKSRMKFSKSFVNSNSQ